MVGIVDVGGGMRCAYSAGIYDFFLDNSIRFDYCLGVSAGSANLISYIAGQRGRNIVFYTEYSRRKEYMSVSNLLKKGSYIDLDYVYSTLCDDDGEYPIDYKAVFENPTQYYAVATNAENGKAEYFGKNSISVNNIDIIKASCCLPVFCKPYFVGGQAYFDGGVAEPIPYKKAFADGCDKVVVVLTKPIDYIKSREKHLPVIKSALKKYPAVYEDILVRHEKYNQCVSELKMLEKEGKALILAPTDCFGVDTLTNKKVLLEKLYKAGYDETCERMKKINRLF